MQQKIFFIITAPSGAGKNTVINQLLERMPNLQYAKSATTRKMRQGESQGKPYYFLSQEEFRNKIDSNALYEYQEVYAGLYYGVLKEEIERIWSEGKMAISDIEVLGAKKIKELLGDQAKVLFLAPPSVTELESRLRARGKETEEQIHERLRRVQLEMGYQDSFDALVINDNLEKAVDAVEEFINKACEQLQENN